MTRGRSSYEEDTHRFETFDDTLTTWGVRDRLNGDVLGERLSRLEADAIALDLEEKFRSGEIGDEPVDTRWEKDPSGKIISDEDD